MSMIKNAAAKCKKTQGFNAEFAENAEILRVALQTSVR